ncbi:hypothetical protein [Pelagicoccus sp. SDUM812003]|uniref:hypothetical protein n=1 Tax=Pelagicoccus sp. SDUM812003 TaxID=3041267 RepID=UPI00280E43B0|nr:hypothetical protein [Pelagicoccus sp. SDUM812003]MDQ8201542.1 hypothetical protein [Pelagicoccus sp. SDUM812003]
MRQVGQREIAFKCLYGGRQGWGHIVRCSALAAAFRESGWKTTLWSENADEPLPDFAAKEFDEVTKTMPREAEVLLVDEMYTKDSEFDWLRQDWESVSSSARLFIGIDDMQQRSMGSFDLAINCELGLESAVYRSKHALLGERFALLRKGIGEPEPVNDWELPRGSIPVLVMIGGTDAYRYTDRALNSLFDWRGDEVVPIVVYGASSENRIRVMNTIGRFRRSRFLERIDASQLAGWMAFCSFAVVACGSTLYELAAANLPFLGISLVDNQTAFARKVADIWEQPVVFREGMHHLPLNISYELDLLLERGRVPYSNVDTEGADRVRRKIEELLAS